MLTALLCGCSALMIARAPLKQDQEASLKQLEADTERMVVLEISTQGALSLSPTDLGVLAEHIRHATSSLNPRRFQLITRENQLILVPPDQTPESCLEGECEVEIGRLTNAQWVIASRAYAVDTGFRVSMRLLQTETGQVLSSEMASGSGLQDLEVSVYRHAISLLRALDDTLTSADELRADSEGAVGDHSASVTSSVEELSPLMGLQEPSEISRDQAVRLKQQLSEQDHERRRLVRQLNGEVRDYNHLIESQQTSARQCQASLRELRGRINRRSLSIQSTQHQTARLLEACSQFSVSRQYLSSPPLKGFIKKYFKRSWVHASFDDGRKKERETQEHKNAGLKKVKRLAQRIFQLEIELYASFYRSLELRGLKPSLSVGDEVQLIVRARGQRRVKIGIIQHIAGGQASLQLMTGGSWTGQLQELGLIVTRSDQDELSKRLRLWRQELISAQDSSLSEVILGDLPFLSDRL